MRKPAVVITCVTCGAPKSIPAKEYKRQVKKGRTQFFCSLACNARAVNVRRRAPVITLSCPVCGESFIALAKKRRKMFCSSSCAAKGHRGVLSSQGLEALRESGRIVARENFQTVQATMKTREAWKYVLLREVLTEKNISFEFEFMLPDASWVYDLGLLSMKLIVEFDGPEHKASRKQRCEDQERDNYARSLGWDVTRIPVLPKTVIDPTTVMEVIAKVNN